MKILGAILGIILILLVGAYSIAFTDFGNSITKPYVEKILKEKTGYDIKLREFDLNIDDFDITAELNNEIAARAKGKYFLFDKSFDFDYALEVANLKSFGVELNEKMNLNGKAVGNIDKFAVNGSGKAFDSDIKFLANLLEMKPTDLQIDAKNLSVEKILAVAKQPIYAKGNLDIISDIKSQNNEPSGTANIKSANLVLNEKVFADMNLTIPANTKVALNSDIRVANWIANAKSTINSNLANLSANESIYDIKNNTLKTDFALKIDDLAKIAKIINYETSGNLIAKGNLQTDMKKFELTNTAIKAFNGGLLGDFNGIYEVASKDGKINGDINIADFSKLKNLTKQDLKGSAKGKLDAVLKKGELENLNLNLDALGGNLVAKGNLGNLNINAKSLNLAVITSFLGLEAMANGNLNAVAKLDLRKDINGNAEFSVANGTAYKKFLDKTTGKAFPSDVKFSLNGKTNIKNSVANFNSIINTDLANMEKFDGSYNIKNGALNANYILNVPSLAKLKFIVERDLKGGFKGNGEIKKSGKNFSATLNSQIAKGTLNGSIINDDATFKLSKFDIKSLTDFLNLGYFYDGIGDANLVYNTKSKKGKFDALINQGKLAKKGLVNTVSSVLGRDLSSEVYNNATIDGNIVKDLVDFKANMQAQKSKLIIEKGTLNLASKAINIPISANIEKTDLSVQITGTTENPKYAVDSAYLKQKIGKEIGRGLDRLLGGKKDSSGGATTDGTTDGDANNAKDKSSKEKAKDAVRDILKGLF